MLIKSLKLRNIRSYTNEVIEFPDNILLLAGDIGSGKTTVLLAIEFALFGIKRGDLSGSSLLRNGQKEGYVELSFVIEGKDVIVNRTLKRSNNNVKQDTGFIIVGGRKIEGTATELKAKVLEILGYPKNILTKGKDLVYRYTIFTPQEEMKSIIYDDVESRLDTLRKVFDIDKYKRIRENSSFIIRELKTKKKVLNSKLEHYGEKVKQRDGYVKEIESKQEEVVKVTERKVEISKIVNEGKEKLKSTEVKIEELKKYQNDLKIHENNNKNLIEQKDKLLLEKQQCEKIINKLNQDFNSINIESKIEKEIEDIEKSIEEKNKIINENKIKKSSLIEKSNNLKQRKEQLSVDIEKKTKVVSESVVLNEKKQKIEDLVKNKQDVLNNIKTFEDELNKNLIEITKVQHVINSSSEFKDKIVSLEQCPTCFQDVNSDHKLKIRNEEELKVSDAKFKLEKISNKKEDIEKNLSELKKMDTEINKNEKLLFEINTKLELVSKLSSELVERKEELIGLKNDEDKLMIELNELNMIDVSKLGDEVIEEKKLLVLARQYKEKKVEKENISKMIIEKKELMQRLIVDEQKLGERMVLLSKEVSELNENIKSFGDIVQRYESFKEKFDIVLRKQREVELKEVSLLKEKEGVEKLLDKFNLDLSKLDLSKIEVEKINKNIHWLEEFFINLMDTIEKHVMLKIYREFNELFVDWFNVLLEDETINVRLDETFTPIVMQNGYETKLTDLSGGEKTSVALAYRLSLNKVINDFVTTIKTKDLIILDEPTDGFSTEQLDNVRNVLDQLNMKQIIIVSHESKIESYVDSVIRISKHEHVSKVLN